MATCASALPDAREQEAKGKKGPRDGVGHVTGEVAGELKNQRAAAGWREEVGNLDVEQEEREDDAERIQERRRGDAGNLIARRLEQSGADEEAGDHASVAVEIPIQHRGAAGMI